MNNKREYEWWPSIIDNEGIEWDLLDIHFAIDWGRRQADITCQRKIDGNYSTKIFSIYPLNTHLNELSDQYIVIMINNMFKHFDKVSILKNIKKNILKSYKEINKG